MYLVVMMINQVMRNITLLVFIVLLGFLLTPQNDVLSNNKANEIVYL